ncbi:hypothetical protein R1sor_022008 [Riccia sorocarpa]|uniref:Reverse transcriptase domain-containing protein n=1 Tax=Riccia sorocarpa TaxID=122646 RepID=A0ABD3GIL6_9MARC
MDEMKRVWSDHDPSCADPRRNHGNASDTEVQEITAVEAKILGLEQRDEDLWRKRSMARWLSQGEAPTKFFFSLAKANFSKEKIHALEDPQLGALTTHKEIMDYVHSQYMELYDAQQESRENQIARVNILQLLDTKLRREDAHTLDAVPEDEEIEDTVKTLKTGRAPGLDGVTADFIQQRFLPQLVAVEQTGFIPGRKIEDNVMTLKMAEEWSTVADEDNLFVKLDFSKAFDMVSFKYMWGVLKNLGFSQSMVNRIKALMV